MKRLTARRGTVWEERNRERLGPNTGLPLRQVHDRGPAVAFSELAEKPPPTTCLTPLITNRYKARYRGVMARQSTEYCDVGLGTAEIHWLHGLFSRRSSGHSKGR